MYTFVAYFILILIQRFLKEAIYKDEVKALIKDICTAFQPVMSQH